MIGASAGPVDPAISLNQDARLRALRAGLLVLAVASARAVDPASRLPDYRPGELPE